MACSGNDNEVKEGRYRAVAVRHFNEVEFRGLNGVCVSVPPKSG